MEPGTVLPPLVGGMFIGLGAVSLLLFNGRIAGISGIVGGLVTTPARDPAWRVAFVAGLVGAGLLLAPWMPSAFGSTLERSSGALVLAGLLVGFGTRLGNGCTSGHGVCGLSRLSPRSAVATVTFMAVGAGVAAVVTQVFGGVL